METHALQRTINGNAIVAKSYILSFTISVSDLKGPEKALD